MIRTGYSFRTAVGSIDDVQTRLQEIGWKEAVVCDRTSTFAYNRWTAAAKERGMRCVYGAELGVAPALDKRPIVDYWFFLATENLRSVHDLVYRATSQRGTLLYSDSKVARGVIKISGSRLLLEHAPPPDDPTFFVGMTPSTPKGLFKAAKEAGHKFCAISDNVYPRPGDKDAYNVVMGKRVQNQTYPQHILSDAELHAACWYATEEDFAAAVGNRQKILDACRAEMKKATMIAPPRLKPLRDMCEEGAAAKGVDLDDPIYAERLERELKLIGEKKFEDYFYVVADLLQWSKKEMICGPGRGSSSGSLVCFLLDITAVDPIKYDLVFERFIDITRADFPDVDIDMSEDRRELALKYLEEKYGSDRVARLGTVGLFQSRSAINAAGAAIGVPKWMLENVSNAVITRSKGDSRADYKVEDSFKITDAGKKLIREYPAMEIAGKIEAHPHIRGQHAAGMVMTNDAVREYVAVDAANSTAMCDWQDAKDLDLLKVDVLGLTQLSIFEQTLRLIGKPDVTGFLESVPLDDLAAFDVLNRRHLAGVFQFQGGTTKQVVHQLDRISEFEDIVSITALCRPGPLGSGGTQEWINRKNGNAPVQVFHEAFMPYLEKTLGIMVYQEQIMRICREIGGMSWGDVTALRKAMGKSLGMEYFDGYRDKFLPQAVAKGIPEEKAVEMWNGMCSFGMYGFNRAHAVAYGLITYWCCWLKAHHPVEFAAATLDSEIEPDKQIAILRELKQEGIDYVPVDFELSDDRWNVAERDGKKILIGPLTTVKGIGPATMMEILDARRRGVPARDKLREKFVDPVTAIDSLYPVRDAVRRLWPDLAAARIVTQPTLVKDVFAVGGEVLVIGVLVRNHPLNENEPARIARRGYAVTGPVNALNLHLRDDTDDIFCKVSRYEFERIGHVLTKGRPGKSIFAVKGNVPATFRMIWVQNVRYLGEIDDYPDSEPESDVAPPPPPSDGPAGEQLQFPLFAAE